MNWGVRFKGGCRTSSCSIVIINTNRTKYRTTLTTDQVNGGALLVAVGLRVITFVPYGPTINNPTGNVIIHRISTLNNRVKHGASGACVRVEVLGANGKPTIETLQTRTSGHRCSVRVGRALRGRPGLALHRNVISSLVIRRKGVGNIIAGAKTYCKTGTIILAAKATTHNGVVVNRLVCSSNPGGARPTVGLSRGLRHLNFGLGHFGAKAPPQISKGAVSCTGARRRPNSSAPRLFDCRDGSRSCLSIGGRLSY